MSLGYDVSKGLLDAKSAQAAVALREAFDRVEYIANWLSDHPVVEGVDPLTSSPFNYSEDEAGALRLYFETFSSVRNNNDAAFAAGRKLTGLE